MPKYGWREVAYRSALEEAQPLRREMPMMGLWRFLGRTQSAERREEIQIPEHSKECVLDEVVRVVGLLNER